MNISPSSLPDHREARCRGDIATASLCTSQLRPRYASNETPKEVSVERCQDVSVVRLHNALLERRDNVSRGRNKTQRRLNGTWPRRFVVRIHHVPLVRFYEVFCNSQMKHPITSLWDVSAKSRSYAVATPC